MPNARYLPIIMGIEKRVYILGAGCSYDGEHGYPLASQFIGALEKYSARIEGREDCQRIKEAVDDTVGLLKRSGSSSWHASTIDQLIDLVYKGQCDEELRGVSRPAAARKAKIAASACFLELEPSARRRQIPKYRQFISGKILNETGMSAYTRQRLKQSNACVLSFNYDRLFELAFFAGFRDPSLDSWSPYSDEVLNAGLTVFGDLMEIDPNRFSLLKLHGSIGMFCGEDVFPEQVRACDDVGKWTEPKLTDDLFFPDRRSRREPLIVFPFEKDFIVSGNNNGFAFRKYINHVWEHATLALQAASEIWAIGYSFDATDCTHLLSRLRQAKNCKRIVIQNLPDECERIRSLLTIDHRLKVPIQSNTTPF